MIKNSAKVDKGISTLKERFQRDAELDHFSGESWKDGVFQSSGCSIESLEQSVGDLGIANAIAH